MLELKNITKVYKMGDSRVDALKGVSLSFRKSEFVAILGPSGCGKTTLLNIVGGLDRYTEGDLIINGKSTKEFKDRDWDFYRNHSVGFVFQSYNLIPHQTVLENVELALTLSGVSREERKRRATEVLEKVGLGDKLKSRPNQLSGGQMQRVAIARALVNDPEIILADEPTGALDTASSVQIMEILKEISKDRLIVMVTHNPDLANMYSSRIVKLLDGDLISDSDPYTEPEIIEEVNEESKEVSKKKKRKKEKRQKTSMSFLTALALSFKNLLTKKGRTILVSFAGSIGIIGIALILAISSGFSKYVNKMQEDTLSSYPITIEAKSVDLSTIMMSFFTNALGSTEDKKLSHEKDAIYTSDSISSIFDSIGDNIKTNNLKKFYAYINEHYDEIKNDVNAIQYTYDIGLSFFTDEDKNVQPYSTALYDMIISYTLKYVKNKTNTEIIRNPDKTFTIKATENTDYTYMEGFPQMGPVVQALKSEETNHQITLDRAQLNAIISATLGIIDISSYQYTNTRAFYEMIDNESLIKEQYDLVAGRYIENDNEVYLILDKNSEIDDYILYSLGLISYDDMDESLTKLLNKEEHSARVSFDSVIGKEYKVLAKNDNYREIAGLEGYTDVSVFANYMFADTRYFPNIQPVLDNCNNKVKIAGVLRLNENVDNGCLSAGVGYTNGFTEKMIAYYNNDDLVKNNVEVRTGYSFITNTFTTENLKEIKLDDPTAIYIYVNTFEAKDKVKAFVNKYNETAEQGDEITYSDMVGTIMSTVSTIINAITYVLIAFVSVSLIVSSIMIGIITYISVIERTKEIGVLRSVGASKADVRHVFTAETFIIGLTSGAFGIIIALLFTIPINLVLKHYTGISHLASLPWLGAIALIAISIVLTLIAGLIPSRVAAKKDPVVALRTE